MNQKTHKVVSYKTQPLINQLAQKVVNSKNEVWRKILWTTTSKQVWTKNSAKYLSKKSEQYEPEGPKVVGYKDLMWWALCCWFAKVG